jgi:hypothetical protein
MVIYRYYISVYHSPVCPLLVSLAPSLRLRSSHALLHIALKPILPLDLMTSTVSSNLAVTIFLLSADSEILTSRE